MHTPWQCLHPYYHHIRHASLIGHPQPWETLLAVCLDACQQNCSNQYSALKLFPTDTIKRYQLLPATFTIWNLCPDIIIPTHHSDALGRRPLLQLIYSDVDPNALSTSQIICSRMQTYVSRRTFTFAGHQNLHLCRSSEHCALINYGKFSAPAARHKDKFKLSGD